MYEEISKFRINKGRGVISKFDKTRFDEYSIFSRIGDGSLGGKARGLAFIDSIIKKYQIFYQYDDVIITIPRTVVLCTDIFDEFMQTNNLYEIALEEKRLSPETERFGVQNIDRENPVPVLGTIEEPAAVGGP